MIDARSLVGTHDVLLMTFDTLRLDVAEESLVQGLTPNLAAVLPGGRWEPRHTSGSFTYAAHQAFLAGFLPTPIAPGRHVRLFAAEFAGSETTAEQTYTFEAATVPEGLAAAGYRTVCVGGVGFFNPSTALGQVLPSYFQESYWSEFMGVTNQRSTEVQAALVEERLAATDQRVFLLVNLSALHQPNCGYVKGAMVDSPKTQAAALQYVDSQLPRFFNALAERGSALCILCSDHGTAYGEDGYLGHRLAHPVVWSVPYAEFILPGKAMR